MISIKNIYYFYFLILLMLASLVGLSKVYEQALVETDRHALSAQAEVVSIRFKSEIMRQEFRKISEAFGQESPNMVFEVWDDSHGLSAPLFRSREGESRGQCADSSAIEGTYRIKVCRSSGPLATIQQKIKGRAMLLMLVAIAILFAAIAVCIHIIKESISGSLLKISTALGAKPLDPKAPLQELLAKLSEQRSSIEEFEQKIAANARFAAIGAITAQFQHDVGNPLNIIAIALKDKEGDPDLREEGLKAAYRVKKMVEEMGNFSKSLRVKLDQFKLIDPIRVASDELKAGDESFDVQIDCDEDLHAKGDALGLIRVLTNICKNGLEAGSRKIRIMTRQKPELGKIEINVLDWGKGIPSDLLPKLFKPFVTFNKKDGTGLGLWHGSQLIAAMNGSLSIHSPGIDGSSTTVTILLQKGSSQTSVPTADELENLSDVNSSLEKQHFGFFRKNDSGTI